MRMKLLAALTLVAALAMAQKVKTKEEAEALQAIQKETDPVARMAKVDDFVKKFADTEFKSWAYTRAAEAAQAKNDTAKIIIYCDLAMDADPKAYQAMLIESGEIARTTRENDLDKDDKLAKATKLAKQAIEIAPTIAKVNAQIPDAQWEEVKKEFVADGHRDLGMIATVQKKYDVAIAEYKQSIEIPAQPDPVGFIRLAAAYTDNNQPDEALAVLAKVPANSQLAPFVDKEKKRAEAAKASKK